ncbi:8-oxo-dGTP pyrophosphatase MutT (NUDIX family) [Lysobacter niabensis]|uniref:8-oxo-dGTP pyrophosphatase MutT (NUDIX family) n=1 Tax=Agrilutibacter niabensis TaxID=380628 RepID=A0ABU1VNY5_9GAMM|nr:8-oxo-dGTP pyrophosphatase MutT (NUDIX family) [Lysobacter niabensis]
MFPIDRIAAALHPLTNAPVGEGWNHAEIIGLLPEGRALVEAAVLVGLIRRDEGMQVLLTRRTDALRNHAGQVSFPGGRLEADDADAVAAATRETFEEVGIPASLITPLGYLDAFTTITGFRVLPVVATIANDYVARPDANEVAEVFEVPLAFLLDPANLASLSLEHRGRARQVWEFSYPGQRIWGVTAAIVVNLRERLAAAVQ